MPRKKQSIPLMEAVDSLVESKNLDKEFIIKTLKFCLAKAYKKVFLNDGDISDSAVRAELEKVGKEEQFVVYYGRKVLADDDINDDYLEISNEDHDVIAAGKNIGDIYEVKFLLKDLISDNFKGNKFMNSFMTSFKSKIMEAEKKNLVDLFGAKKGELVTGVVEQYNKETREAMINIGNNTTVPLERRDQIGDETFKQGESIKVCILKVESTPQGATIRISRSDPTFLRRLFEQEIHEIYDGTVIIKDIARKPGERSKVSVYSQDPNVDARGTCIGKNADRIQNITKNLGNSKEKEKIDIILYQENKALYIAEALAPGRVVGVAFKTQKNPETNKDEDIAVAVVQNGEVPKTVGKEGVNVYLAVKLVGMKIDVITADEAMKQKLSYKTIESIKSEETDNKQAEIIENYEEEINDEMIENPNVKADEVVETLVDEDVKADEPKEVVSEEKHNDSNVVNETVEVKEEDDKKQTSTEETSTPHVEIKDGTTMEDLLSKLMSEKEKEDSKKKTNKKSNKKKENQFAQEKQESSSEEKKNSKIMAVYTDEELAEIEREENEEDSYGLDYDDDYDEYDSDDYYKD